MRYLSVCSGIEAATVAWHGMGWKPVAFSEIEKFPNQVLKHHYPDVPNLGDMTNFKEWSLNESINILVGGTPCQSFSIAGLRKGLEDPRGNLMLTYLGILDKFRPKWCVWENVPGVLSSNGGRDFGSFLGALAQLGYGFAYRVLDAQNFGVAQRRRRVFVVGYLGDWRRAAAVLFERESLRGDIKKGKKAREGVAGTLTRGFGDRGLDLDQIAGGAYEIRTVGSGNISKTLMAGSNKQDPEALSGDYHILQPIALAGNTIGRQPENGGNHTGYDESGVSYTLTKTDVHAVAYSFDSLSSNSMKSSNPISGCNEVDICKTLDTSRGLDPSCNQGGIAIAHAVAHAFKVTGASKADKHESTTYVAQPMAFDMAQITSKVNGTRVRPGLPVSTLAKGSQMHVAMVQQPIALAENTIGRQPDAGYMALQAMQVRRLTPVECERLQGFPDGYTDIMPKGKQTPDGPRYKALGNSMAVPVMEWIGKRIERVDKL